MIYVVQNADSVDRIADINNIPVEELIYDNQLEYPYRLAIGQALYIRELPLYDRRSIYVNGYAYPFINEFVLDESLEYLSTLSVFSYGFTTDGTLIPPLINDEPMIRSALGYRVRPILTLTPLDEEGRFNNNLIHQLLHDEAASANLIDNILAKILEAGFDGVDVDFEYIMAEDRDLFTTFVANLRYVLNEYGYTVSVALAPKSSADQPGLLYEGKDYGGLGAAANSVLLMTYEWGYTYSEPRAVAPINLVRKVVDYALTEIPVSKIDMGIPNYGYDWPLPYEKGVTRATTIGNVQAINIAVRYGAVIQYDELAQTPFFDYVDDDGISHQVWFEDVRSIRAKLELINEYGLRGAGYWQIMRLFRAGWLQLEEMYEVRKE